MEVNVLSNAQGHLKTNHTSKILLHQFDIKVFKSQENCWLTVQYTTINPNEAKTVNNKEISIFTFHLFATYSSIFKTVLCTYFFYVRVLAESQYMSDLLLR